MRGGCRSKTSTSKTLRRSSATTSFILDPRSADVNFCDLKLASLSSRDSASFVCEPWDALQKVANSKPSTNIDAAGVINEQYGTATDSLDPLYILLTALPPLGRGFVYNEQTPLLMSDNESDG